ncbi:acyl-CoA dehydrogenase [Nocardia alba]|uniref:Alkylation response protein AidB-like acyl-CoA dehydrogenase n=1 Tax=Nocardia alba TaxID=225051 RepID=A0A4R1FRP4_9NOCA|nr:acyl-CoA dehydrogenase [Nocardia alba]TCJ97637.1 alkylation response protein AidB-like acyl-CoA dehydrogenase [Nocardia alba]
MGIALTEEHRALAEVTRRFATDRAVRQAARELLDAATEDPPAFWAQLAELGLLGLHVDPAYGGSGYGLPESVVVVEELGRAIAPGLFVSTVITSAVVAAVGSAEQRERFLPGLVDGTVTAAVGFGDEVTIDNRGRAHGRAGVVLGAGSADLLLICAGDDVVILERTAAGISIQTPSNMDPTRRSGRVTLRDVTVAPHQVLVGARAAAVARARLLFAAEAAGGAGDCVDAAVGYAAIRTQFGRPIATFQAVKHHCANMLVEAESAVATVWDAARAATDDERQFQLMAAAAATIALPAYVHNAELNIQVHGGVGFTWAHDAHLHLRRAVTLRALIGGDAPATDVFTLTSAGVGRTSTVDLPAAADQVRAGIRADVERIAAMDESIRLPELITTGYVMPHWPKPWGRSATAVEQVVIDEEFTRARLTRPDYSITGWVVLTLIQHGTPGQIDRFVERALRQEEVWCQLFSEPDAGSDAAAVKTTAMRVDGGWRITGQKVWTSGAHYSRRGLATVRTDPGVAKHAGITTMIIDMAAPGVQVRPLRMLLGSSEFNEVFFDEVFVPDADVVGAVNDGWAVARATLGNERVSIGGGSGTGNADSGTLLRLVERHRSRSADTDARVGRYLAQAHALRLLNLRRAVRSIEGTGAGPEGNITKLKVAQNLSEYAAITAMLLGPDIALADGDAAMAGLMVLGARAMSIAGGTSEVTRNQIAERILGMPRDPLLR